MLDYLSALTVHTHGVAADGWVSVYAGDPAKGRHPELPRVFCESGWSCPRRAVARWRRPNGSRGQGSGVHFVLFKSRHPKPSTYFTEKSGSGIGDGGFHRAGASWARSRI